MEDEGAVLYETLTPAGTGLFGGFGAAGGEAACDRAQGLVLPLVAGVTAGLVVEDPPSLISRLKGLVDLVVSTEGGVRGRPGDDFAFRACNLA